MAVSQRDRIVLSAMTPFQLHYSLSRRQRLAVELVPWLPAIAATVGFGTGAAYLVVTVSPWFAPLLLLPVALYRGLFAFAFDILVHAGRRVELAVGPTDMELRSSRTVKRVPLQGIFQVFRAEGVWTVLHLDGSVFTIPASAIAADQVEYLRSFTRRTGASSLDHPSKGSHDGAC
jgi:hypothetical protein